MKISEVKERAKGTTYEKEVDVLEKLDIENVNLILEIREFSVLQKELS